MKEFIVYGIKGTKGRLLLGNIYQDKSEHLIIEILKFELGGKVLIAKNTKSFISYNVSVRSYCLGWFVKELNANVLLPIQHKNNYVFKYIQQRFKTLTKTF